MSTFDAHFDGIRREVSIYYEMGPEDADGTCHFLARPPGVLDSREIVPVHHNDEPPAWDRLKLRDAKKLRDALNAALPPDPAPDPAPTFDERLLRIVENLSKAER